MRTISISLFIPEVRKKMHDFPKDILKRELMFPGYDPFSAFSIFILR